MHSHRELFSSLYDSHAPRVELIGPASNRLGLHQVGHLHQHRTDILKAVSCSPKIGNSQVLRHLVPLIVIIIVQAAKIIKERKGVPGL
jgi:hypothetical protein